MNRGLFGAFDYDTWLSTPPEPWSEPDVDEDEAYDRWKDNVAMGYEQKKGHENEQLEYITAYVKFLEDQFMEDL